MATRTLEVQITGDPSKFNRSLGHVDTSVDRTSGKFKNLGKVGKAAFSGLGLAAGAAAAVGLKQAADAAVEAEKTQARLEAQLKASGIAYKSHADRIDEVIGKVSRLSGLDDEDLTDSFTNIVRVTGDVNKSLRLTGLAADFARAKHMDVAKAGELVGKVAGGNTGILGRYGITLKDGATATEALGKLQEKFKGQAKAYGDTTAGSMEKAAVAWENLLEIVGEKIAPVVRKAAELLTGLFDKTSKGNRVLRRLSDAYMDWLHILRDVVRSAVRVVENWVDKNRDSINDVIRAFRRVGNFIKDIVTTVIIPIIKRVAPIVKDFAETVARVIGRMVKLVAALINGDWDKAWDNFKDIILDLVKSIPRIMVRLLRAFNDGFKKMVSAIGKAGEDLGNAIIDGMVEGIKDGANKIKDAATGVVKGAVDKASDVASSLNPFGDGVGWSPIPTTGGVGPSSLMGADAALSPFASIAAKFGLSVTSGQRDGSITSSGNLSLHATGDAIDVSNGYSTPQELAFFNFMKKNYGSQLAELIYTPGGAGIKNGQSYTFTGQVAADHYDHVHVGYTGGIGDGIGHTSGMSGRKPGTGDGIGRSAALQIIADAAKRAGILPQTLYGVWGAESNFALHSESQSGAGAIGPFQFMPATARGMGVNPLDFKSAAYGAARYLAQYKSRGLAGMLAAYNAGPAGNPNNPETQAYIPRVRGFAAQWPGVGGQSGGSPGAGGGGGGTAKKNPARAKWEAAQEKVKGKAKDAAEAARNEALTGGGALELSVARAQTLQARATSKDDLAGLIKGLKQERDVKRRRLKRVRKLLKRKHRLGRKNRVALLNEEASLLADIGDLNETIKEYKADQKGGATTVSRAEELDAGVDPNAADAAADAGGGGGGADTSAADEAQAARDAIAAELAELVRQQVANQQTIIRLTTQQGPQILAAVIAAVNGDIGGKVGLGYQTPGYAGGTAKY